MMGLIFLKSSFEVEAISDIENLQAQIDELAKLKTLSENATTPLEKEVADLEARINSAQTGITKAKQQAAELAVSIEKREKDLIYHYQIFSNRVAESYKRTRVFNPLSLFLASQSASQLTKDLAYQESARAQDDRLIRSLSEEISSLNADKKQLESDQVRLAALSKQLDAQAEFFKGEIAKAKSYQSELSGQIAALSAQQQAILSEKSGTFQTTVGDVPLADDPASRPDYNPGFSPAFAAFSFGAPHFKGMSQYGALGRAKSGQSYETILKAYYGDGIEIKDHNPDQQISVDGYGSYSLEEYTKRIYEVPNSWGDDGGMEALKAQAVAARSYALARGGTICATETCQVFKPEAKGGNWEKAVNETRGKVVYANGQPFSTWYASTSGGYQESYSANGYSTPGFWDTANGRSGWTGQAYEKIAGSPWFYKAWYKTRSGDNCGRSNPWLSSEEMADILNAWVVMYKGGGDSSRVTPESSCWGGNPYSKSDLRNIGGYSSVSEVSVNYSDNGTTANVTFQTNKGSVTINGNEFYKTFNLRAPARISLKSGLFNIEKK
ncbi:MAG TPA: SpoIID/LytB domain-containing protein [Candidatus Woesebacteria bacterium]|nr:SpoIID/LytB domain-containing protein [Candidatus Woesebacteria bacterium]